MSKASRHKSEGEWDASRHCEAIQPTLDQTASIMVSFCEMSPETETPERKMV